MNHLAISLLLAFATSFLSALFILMHKPRTKIKSVWAVFNIFVSLWSLPFFIQSITTNHEISLFCFRLSNIHIIFIGCVYVHFAIEVANLRKRKSKEIIFHYIFSIFFYIFTIMKPDLFIENVIPKFNFSFYAHPGKIYFLSPIFLTLQFVYAFFLMLKAYPTTTVINKNQIKYVFIGSIIGILGGASTYFPAFNIDLYPYANYLTPAYVVMVTYSMAKYKLMDIHMFFTRGLIYTLTITLLSLSYLLTIFLLESLFQSILKYESMSLKIFVAFIFGVIFIPIRNFAQKLIEKSLFKATTDEMSIENEHLKKEITVAEKNKAVAQLASGIAHEIRNPLTTLKTFYEHLDTKGDDKEFLKKFNNTSKKEFDRIENLTQQLLDFAKPSKPEFVPANPIDVINDTLDLTENSAKKHNIEIIKDFGKTQRQLEIDPNQIKQALINLILNAIDAMEHDGTLTIKTFVDGNNYIIEINDTGCGIDDKTLKNIFTPFHTTKIKGTGLGLSITKNIVETHGGELTVKSTLNEGTTFKITL